MPKSFLYRLERADDKLAEKCKMCSGDIVQKFFPMEQWHIEGPLCGKCYSKKIAEHYPGEHVRVDTSKKQD